MRQGAEVAHELDEWEEVHVEDAEGVGAAYTRRRTVYGKISCALMRNFSRFGRFCFLLQHPLRGNRARAHDGMTSPHSVCGLFTILASAFCMAGPAYFRFAATSIDKHFLCMRLLSASAPRRCGSGALEQLLAHIQPTTAPPDPLPSYCQSKGRIHATGRARTSAFR